MALARDGRRARVRWAPGLVAGTAAVVAWRLWVEGPGAVAAHRCDQPTATTKKCCSNYTLNLVCGSAPLYCQQKRIRFLACGDPTEGSCPHDQRACREHPGCTQKAYE